MNNLSDKFRRERFLRRLSVISIAAAAAIVFLFFIVLMYNSGLIELPGFIALFIGDSDEDKTEVIPGDDGRIYDALSRKKNIEGVSVTRNITDKDAAAFFAELEPAEEYSLRNRVILYYGGKSVTYLNHIWRQGKRYRIETYDADKRPVKTTVCDGENVYVTVYTDGEGSTRSFPADESFTLEQQAGMISAERVLAALKAAQDPETTDSENAPDDSAEEKSAEKGDVLNISISLIRTAKNSVYHVEYDCPDLPLHERLFVSIEYGFVTYAETRMTDGDEPIYILETEFMQTGITGYSGPDIFSPDK